MTFLSHSTITSTWPAQRLTGMAMPSGLANAADDLAAALVIRHTANGRPIVRDAIRIYRIESMIASRLAAGKKTVILELVR